MSDEQHACPRCAEAERRAAEAERERADTQERMRIAIRDSEFLAKRDKETIEAIGADLTSTRAAVEEARRERDALRAGLLLLAGRAELFCDKRRGTAFAVMDAVREARALLAGEAPR